MKKILLVPIMLAALAIPASSLVLAQFGAPNTVPNTDVMAVLERIVDWAFSILLVFAAIMIVIAGFYFVTASGDPERVATARNFVLWALIGVLVAFLSRGMVALVRRIVGY